VRTPQSKLVGATDEQGAYEQVRAVADRAVPVVGPGLAAAGAPSGVALRAALAAELDRLWAGKNLTQSR
jgi:hypothetical protein